MKKNYCFIFLIFVFTSCVKDKPDDLVKTPVELSNARKVYVVNEGPFGNGASGSVSLYDTGTNEVVEDFYQQQNQALLGNVVQSLTYFQEQYYIVVNNANRIVVCDKSLKKKTQITGLTSPRYILPISNQKAYVSDLYANALNIVDLNEYKKTGSISCFGKTEQMVLFYNKVFVTNSEQNYVYVVNALLDKIEDSVFVGKGASSIVTDKYDKIWVLASGQTPTQKGRLSKIDPLTNKVLWFEEFSNGDSPFNLCINGSKDALFYLNNSIYKIKIDEAHLPASALVNRETKNFYGLGINPNDNSIYAADAMDYSQRSQIYIYNEDGSNKSNFKAGIIANSFYFE